MADISIIEWGVYGFIAYTSILMLIITAIKEVPATRALSIIRAVYLMPGMVCAAVLAGAGPNITLQNITTNATTRSLNTSEVWTEANTQSLNFAISGQVWTLVHWMIFIVLFIYIVSQILIFMTKTD